MRFLLVSGASVLADRVGVGLANLQPPPAAFVYSPGRVLTLVDDMVTIRYKTDSSE
jgi:hypothetical protein